MRRHPFGNAPFAIIFVLAFAATAHAINDNAGTKNGNFLKLATDARGVALNDVAVSMAHGVDALRWNTAALSTIDNKEVSGTHVQYYQGVTMENVAGGFPMENGGLAASVFYLSAGTLEGYNDINQPTGDFKYYDMVGTLGYGRKFMNRDQGFADVSLGAAIKIVREAIADQTYNNPALDLGATISPLDDWNIGLAVRDLSAGGKADFSREIIGGTSYTLFKVFTGGVAVNYANDAPVRFSVAGEYRVQEIEDIGASIRAGYHTHDTIDSSTDSQVPGLRNGGLAGLTMGAGLNYTPPAMSFLKLDLDYAMAPFGSLGIAHYITVKVRW